MSSSGRFQSRVFSELSRQGLKWRDRLGRWMRTSQVTARWSAQIVLYPLYVGFQTARVAYRQLQQARRRAAPRLQAVGDFIRRITGRSITPALPPSASTPIRKVLAAVEALGLDLSLPAAERTLTLTGGMVAGALEAGAVEAGAIAPAGAALPVTTQITVQGIASALLSHALVLISSENEVLDVLTPTQQVMLRQRMSTELADYWRDRRHTLAPAPQGSLLLPPPTIPDHLLPPVKWFLRLMAWEQQSPVAIAADLFQESTLAHYVAIQAALQPPSEAAALPAPAAPIHALQIFLARFLPMPRPEPSHSSSSPSQSPEATPMAGHVPAVLPQIDAAEPGILPDMALVLRESGAVGRPQAEEVPGELGAVELGGTGSALGATKAALSHPSEAIAVSPLGTPQAEASYVETQARLVGYEQHPLERVLQWLDQGMLWLEAHLILFLQWWREQFRR